jgi:hypothetical protein
MQSVATTSLPIDLAMAAQDIPHPTRRAGRVLTAALLASSLVALAVSAPAGAAITTFGSPLSSPATLDTTASLNYVGTFTPVPPNPEAPNGVFHTAHWGADAALWNQSLAGHSAASPDTGQAVKLRLEGCAQSAPGGPPPLTQIHFQDLSPVSGGVRINLSSGAFDIPVCGENGASGATITTYEPINLCVAKGDYVAFNDEGGYVPYVYRAGVAFQVMAPSTGSDMNSFIRGNGTNNGATLSSTDTSANDGFAENRNEELTMQVVLGTGPDETHICPGGSAGLPPPLPALRIRPQTDGVNHSRIVAVAVYCRPAGGCHGSATLTPGTQLSGYAPSRPLGRANFNLPGNKTSHLQIRVSASLMATIRKHRGASTVLTVSMGGQAFSGPVVVKIF